MPKPAAAEKRVAVRFNVEQLKKLDELVADLKKRHVVMHTAAGRGWDPSRAGALVVAMESLWLQLKNGKSIDPRQVDLVDALERSELAAGVDALERSAKKLQRKTRKKGSPATLSRLRSNKKKKPRPAHRKKRRSATVHRSRSRKARK